LDVTQFRPDATQRRMQRKGDQLLTVRIGEPIVDRDRVRLFNLHRDGRDLGSGDDAIDEDSYAGFLTETCCDTIEITYWHEDRLVAVAIADAGQEALSAVYCFYDPEFRLLSLGTYSVLRHVELCRKTQRRYLYLGFFIAESPHMSYKARFRPHERLVEGKWVAGE
jgi:arginine-tRNA-protein transferase